MLSFLLPKDNSYVLNQECSCPLKCKKKIAEDGEDNVVITVVRCNLKSLKIS